MIALLIILTAVVQLVRFVCWLIERLGFNKSTLEQVLSNTNYKPDYYFAHLLDDAKMIAKVSSEVHRMIGVYGSDYSKAGRNRYQDLYRLLLDLQYYAEWQKQFFPESYKLMDEVLSK